MNLLRDLFSGSISLHQVFLALGHFFSIRRMRSGDDFDWRTYSRHYREELKSIEKTTRLVLEGNDVTSFKKGRLSLRDEERILLPSHHALYEAISWLEPSSVCEVGCGGGDHLHNLGVLFPNLRLNGIDRSDSQLAIARHRHPMLGASLEVADISNSSTRLPKFDVLYSHAVLMHISEKHNRLQTSLNNMAAASEIGLVLVENWTQHDFLKSLRSALETSNKGSWKLYVHRASVNTDVVALIATGAELPLEKLTDYRQVLGLAKVRPH